MLIKFVLAIPQLKTNWLALSWRDFLFVHINDSSANGTVFSTP
jgi:hypothetical protein